MNTYQPQPGTIPHKVMAHFQSLAPEAELSSAELAEAVGAEAGSLSPILATAVKHGALKRRISFTNRRMAYWSRGNGVPLPDDEGQETDEPLHQAPPAPRANIGSPFRLANTKPAETEQKPKKPEQAARAAEQEPPKPKQSPAPATLCTPNPLARFGIFSDGTMTIERGAAHISLSAAEARALVDFAIGRLVA